MSLIDEIRARLTAAFAPTVLAVTDTSAAHAGHHERHVVGATGHFDVRIDSIAFAGQSPLARHRAIYAALGDLMVTHIHALTIDARE